MVHCTTEVITAILADRIEDVSKAAAATGRVKSARKTDSSRRTLAQAREAFQADPEAKQRKSAARKARWDAYRVQKQADEASKAL